jgi:hypothetical protein
VEKQQVSMDSPTIPTAKLRLWRPLLWVAAVPLAILLMIGSARIAVETAFSGIAAQRAAGLSAWAGPFSALKTADSMLSSLDPELASAARLGVVTPEFDSARETAKQVVTERGGYFSQVRTVEVAEHTRGFEATAYLPAHRLDDATTAIRQLGRVRHFSTAAEETAAQTARLAAQLENQRAREVRLTSIVRERSGAMADLLAVEKEIADVRREIADLREKLDRSGARVRYAVLEIQLEEEHRARFALPPSASLLGLRNAALGGLNAFATSLLLVGGFLVQYGLVAAFWLFVCFFVVRIVRRRWRPLVARLN